MNYAVLKPLVFSLLLLYPFYKSFSFVGNDSLQSSIVHNRFEFNTSASYIFPSNEFFKGRNNKNKPLHTATAYHLKYSFRFPDNSSWGRIYPRVYQGIGISYHDFNNREELGAPLSLYLFQGAPFADLSESLSLDYEWNFGASFGWKPYNSVTNSNNTVVGSRVNAYMNFGLYLNWHITDALLLKIGPEVTHFSNGNTSYPNDGVNTVSLRSGLTYCFNSSSSKDVSSPLHLLPFKSHWSYELLLYAASRIKGINSENYLIPEKFGVFGFNFSPLYNFTRYFKAGISLDGVYDESANLENHIEYMDFDGSLHFSKQPFSERFCLGLSARAEFVMPIFSLNFGIGNDILYRGDYSKGLYQVLSLKGSITQNLFLNVGYQLSKFHIPKNLMLGIGYSFQ